MLATDLISRALRIAGVLASGQTADANDSLEALDDVNDMLDQWSLEDLMIYFDKVTTLPLVAGQIQYEIGPTGVDLIMARPIEVLSCNYRDSQNLDVGVAVVSMEDYQRIVQKTTPNTIPNTVAYQPTAPNGTLYVYPPPQAGYSLRLLTNNLFTVVADLSDDVPLPIGYNECFLYELAYRLCIRYGRPEMVDAIKAKAENAKMIVKRKNAKKTSMSIDPSFLPRRSGTYNIYSDT
jgi:hypothetical protein